MGASEGCVCWSSHFSHQRKSLLTKKYDTILQIQAGRPGRHGAGYRKKLLMGVIPGGELGQDDGGEDKNAAEKLAGGEVLVQDDPAGQEGKDGLQAHEKGRDGGVGVLLGDDLQRIGDAAGKNAGVKDRRRGGQDIAG